MIGQSLVHYEIRERIGAGGMGEVYRARDTKLGRDVAIKVLPLEFSNDPERVARFEREARTLASLHHPNVASIFGLEQSGNIRFLAMELIGGENLAEILQRGPLGTPEAIAIARQVAEGLECAHESGIVHRDLKPANIVITSDQRAKILDFGLARAFQGDADAADPANSPTLTAAMTQAGVILGTAAYMSPEQAKGRPVDKRTDIWSFGAILFEMLAGRRAFPGDSVTETLAATLKDEPDYAALPADLPLRVRRLIERCLRKNPRERLRDIGDARLELAEAPAEPGAGAEDAARTDEPGSGSLSTVHGAPGRRGARTRPEASARWIVAAIAGALGILLTLVATHFLRPPSPESPVRRFAVSVPQLTLEFNYPPSISPDGRRLLYSSGDRIWVRDLEQFEPMPVAGAEGAWSFFWSHDSRRIAYYKDEKLWSSDLTGAQKIPVCDLPGGLDVNNGDWGPDGNIVFARYRDGLYTVPAGGGEPRLLLQRDSTEVDFHHPQFLPGGRHIVTVAHRKSGPQVAVVVSVPEGVRKDLGEYEGLSTVRYSPSGHLLLTLAIGIEDLRAVPFSLSKLEITGKPFLVVAGGLFPTISTDGTLSYFLGSTRTLRELVWIDRDGRVERVPGEPQLGLDEPAVSPDGRTVAVATYESGNADLWLLDPTRGTRTRLISGPGDQHRPVWSPDGARLFYLQDDNYLTTIAEIALNGGGAPRRWAQGGSPTVAPDHGSILFDRMDQNREKIFQLELKEGSTPVMLTPAAETRESTPALSPDGHWLAYLSDEPGRFEVFVRSHPDGGHKRQVSLNGGTWPFWAVDGTALYYWERDALMEASVTQGPSLLVGSPRALFTAHETGIELEGGFQPPACAAAPDGRFLMVRRVPGDPNSGILLVQNWGSDFKKHEAVR